MSNRQNHTAELGKELTDKLKSEIDLQVYYDHGGSSDFNTGQPTPYFSDVCDNSTSLASIDIVITQKSKGKERARILIEVEEKEPSSVPKTILGDIFNLFLASSIHFTEKQMFNIDRKIWDSLEEDSIPEELKQLFADNYMPLSQNAAPKKSRGRWIIADDMEKYIVRNTTARLNVCRAEKDFPIDNACLIVGVVSNSKKKKRKVQHIRQQATKLRKKIQKGQSDVQIGRIIILRGDTSAKLIHKIKKIVLHKVLNNGRETSI